MRVESPFLQGFNGTRIWKASSVDYANDGNLNWLFEYIVIIESWK